MKQTEESLMISVVLNTKDPGKPMSVGLRSEHFGAYRDEYEWITRYHKEYGTVPTAEELVAKFPDFPRIDTEIVDPRQVGKAIGRNYARKQLLRGINNAAELLGRDDVEGAYKAVQGLTLESFSPPPENLLSSEDFMDDYEQPDGLSIPYPWPTLQERTGGFHKEQLMYFAARPSQGKSFFLVKLAVMAAKLGYRVMFYSLEMSKRELQVRSHAILGNMLGWGKEINAFAMQHRKWPRENYELLLREIREQVTGELHIMDQSSGRITPSVVASRADEYDISIVDYVGLMSSDRGNKSIEDWRVAAEISNDLKSIAKGKRTRVLAAAQINRAGDANGKPLPPNMSDLAQTDAYVQDADTIVTMTRMRGGHAAVLSNEKNRSGADKARFYTKFLANVGDFSEISKAEAADLCDEMDD